MKWMFLELKLELELAELDFELVALKLKFVLYRRSPMAYFEHCDDLLQLVIS